MGAAAAFMTGLAAARRAPLLAAVVAAAAWLAPRAPASGPADADAAAAVKTPAPPAVADLLSRAEEYVVAIKVEREADVGPQNPLERFSFRRGTRESRAYRRRPPGYATGILVDGEGHVLTTLYNVDGRIKSVAVRLPGGDSRPARVISRSSHDDLALLKVEGAPELGDPASSRGFRPPEWVEPGGLRAGTFVLALGRSPDPERLTVTKGIISAAGRSGGRMIQTDAELNYGNTGGPIVGLDGRLIAIASFVGHTQLQWGLNSGVGFGTAAATVLELLPRMKEGKDIEAPRPPVLGVRGDPAEPETDGARIREVSAETGAARAGIRADDVIFEVDGHRLHNFDQLRRLIYARQPGDLVKLKLRRGGAVVEVEAHLGTAPP